MSEDTDVTDHVFINPDLTVAAEKLAYEKRQKRRQQKLVNMPTDNNSLLTTRRIPNNKDHMKAGHTSDNNARSSIRTDICSEPSTSSENHDLFELSTKACFAGDQTTVITGNLSQVIVPTDCHVSNVNVPDSLLNPDAQPFPTE